MRFLILVPAIFLTACVHQQVNVPIEVFIEKPVPCKVDLPPKPRLTTQDQSVRQLTPDQQLQLAFADYEELRAYIAELEVRLEACRKLPE